MNILRAIIILGIFLIPYQGMASDFDGSKPLLCAVVDVRDCGVESDCQKGYADNMEIPLFLKIDFKENRISSTKESAKVVSTAIENLSKRDGKMIMQGAEHGRGWSMILSEETGKMSVTVSEENFGLVIFGACTPI